MASVTKLIVAAGLMKRVEDGSVVCADPVARYIPELARTVNLRFLFGIS